MTPLLLAARWVSRYIDLIRDSWKVGSRLDQSNTMVSMDLTVHKVQVVRLRGAGHFKGKEAVVRVADILYLVTDAGRPQGHVR